MGGNAKIGIIIILLTLMLFPLSQIYHRAITQQSGLLSIIRAA